MGSSEPTDTDIVNAIRSGQDARVNWAVRWLYRHKAYVTTFIWTDAQRELLRFDEQFVNDLFQETVVTFLRNVWDFKYEPSPNADLRTYLYKISYNKYRTERRNTLTRLGHEQAYALGEDEPITADEVLFEKERFTIVEQLIDQISHSGGDLIRMFDFQRMSHREIAETLGISEAAARMRYHRSRQQLNDILDTYGTSY